MINIGIKDDLIPEIDESILIELYNPTGGSELGLNSQVNIRILANDYVAGVLKLSMLSYIVKEGKQLRGFCSLCSKQTSVVFSEWTIQSYHLRC